MPIRKIFQSANKNDQSEQKAKQLTIAVILFRLVRSDGQAKMLELVHMSELLRKEFALTQQELELVFKLANKEESKGVETSEFIQEICSGLNTQKRIKLIEYLWILAFADDQIEKSEVDLIRRVSQQMALSEIEQATAQENAEKMLKNT